MAQKVQVVLIDDIDGGAATETVSFAVDGTRYEIDLNSENAALLRDDLAKWTTKARKVTAARGRRATTPAKKSRTDAHAVREWARAEGMEVSERGRVSQDLRDAYDAAH
ncbi:histone-like nucleoid-structuring protein Lsr2 [Demequina capsici]|uniref:Lsr2 family protein n=1 Tax=Demequina capsici TaxID=3075620 RepID=A0AA96F7K1_9MICO|nr:Lsr2 family protein [Demequina sp. OYTSA14]WNM24937.1 Lsr2 family protein [Demequina sp. OYTSA14]